MQSRVGVGKKCFSALLIMMWSNKEGALAAPLIGDRIPWLTPDWFHPLVIAKCIIPPSSAISRVQCTWRENSRLHPVGECFASSHASMRYVFRFPGPSNLSAITVGLRSTMVTMTADRLRRTMGLVAEALTIGSRSDPSRRGCGGVS